MENPTDLPKVPNLPTRGNAEAEVAKMSLEELIEDIGKLEEEIENDPGDDEPEYEELPIDESVSDELLDQQIANAAERLDLHEYMQQLNRQAVNLGLLKEANKSPRCAHIKSNGKPCKAPAYGDRSYCVFHFRAHETSGELRMRVPLLEDRESLLLTVKEIMERIVHDDIDPSKASLLLRSLQIANSALKRRSTRKKNQSQKSVEKDILGNPVEDSG